MSALGKTLHGEVASKMAAVRSLLWIRVLGKLTNSVIQNCEGEEFQLKKSAAAVAEQGIRDIADSENL